MHRNRRAMGWLPVLFAGALMILVSILLLPVVAPGPAGTPVAAGPSGNGLTPFVAQGGSTATACDGVATCTTGAIANVDAGDTLMVIVTEFTTSAGAPSSVEEVTSGGDNALTLLGSTPCIAGSGHGVTAIYGLADVAAQASVTFTVTYPATEYYTLHVLDVEGAAASPFETVGAGVCSSAAGTTGTASVTTTVTDDLVILGVEVRASTGISATGGDNLVTDASTTGAQLDSGAMLDEIDPTTGSISLSGTFTSASWSAIAIALKTAPLVSGTVSPSAAAIDAGQTVGLTTTAATGGTPPITYQWYTATSTTCSSGTLINGATGETYTTPALATGTYSYCVWATDSSTPTNQVVYSNVANITVDPALSVTITPSAPSIDRGQTVQLTANPSGGVGTDTYAWYSGSSCSGTVVSTTKVYTTPALTAATEYCVAATDSAFTPATATATATVTVSASPLTVTITPGDPAVDSGKTIQLTAHPSGGTGADTYAWYLGATCSGAVLATTQVYTSPALTAATTYCVAVTDSASTPATATANATILVTPTSTSSSTLPPYVYPAIGVAVALLAALLLLALLARRGRKVTFTQSGLPPETEWSLTFAGTAQRSAESRITFSARKGQYEYLVQPVAGYAAAPTSGAIDVGKDPSDLKITFTSQPSGPSSGDPAGSTPPSGPTPGESPALAPASESGAGDQAGSPPPSEPGSGDSLSPAPTSESGPGEPAGSAPPSEPGSSESTNSIQPSEPGSSDDASPAPPSEPASDESAGPVPPSESGPDEAPSPAPHSESESSDVATPTPPTESGSSDPPGPAP